MCEMNYFSSFCKSYVVLFLTNIIDTPNLNHVEVADTATSKIKESVSLQEKPVIYHAGDFMQHHHRFRDFWYCS